MQRKSWSAEDKAKVLKLRSKELEWSEIGKAVGRTAESCRKLYGEGRAVAPQNPKFLAKKVSPEHVKRDAEQAKEKAAMRKAAAMQYAPPVITGFIDQESVADKWAAAEQENTHRIEVSKARQRFEASFSEDWVLICALSDLHIAPGNTIDLRRMREDAELIRTTERCYAVLAGDAIDNHIKIRPAMLAARSQPSDQWEMFEYWLGIIAPKLFCAVAGNHDEWTNQFAGIDMMGWLMSQRKIHYSKDEARITCKVGGQSYELAMRHQYRMNSSFNQTHAVKQWLRNGEDAFDIGIVGHHHEAAVESFCWHSRQRWAARPGAYQITSAYTRTYGWNDAIPTVPTFLLCGDERRIIGFADIRDALKVLKLA